MPLQDHFHPPLFPFRRWTSFHNSWATFLASSLIARLRPRYYVEQNVRFGIEIDVAASDWGVEGLAPAAGPLDWVPPAAKITLPLTILNDVVEILIYGDDGPTLAGAIELVSPSNKDRAEQREAFTSKCATYLHNGVGLMIVDIVTSRHANLHQELLQKLGAPATTVADGPLYAASYRPLKPGKEEEPVLSVWSETLTVGSPLPTLPLPLRGGACVPLNLEESYERTRQEMDVVPNGHRAATG